MKWYVSICVFFMLIIAYGGILYQFDVSHERVHKRIAELYGGENCSIHINMVASSYMTCLSYQNRTTEAAIEENRLHIENEIEGYNNSSILLFLFVGLFIIVELFFLLISVIESNQGGNSHE